jgi:hypothetical protein
MKRLLLFFSFVLTLAMSAPALAQDTPPPTNEGTFEALSPGGQKIVSAIYDSQLGSTNDQAGGTLLTRDDIAAMKANTGWGNVYKQLQAEGQVTHKNLGQAISSYNHQNRATTTTTVVTTGNGQQIVSGGKKGKGAGAQSLKGGNASSHSGGKKAGQYKNTVVTTGAGGTVSAGPTSHSSAGGASFGTAGGSKGRGKGGSSHKGK